MPAEYNYITGKFKKQTDSLSRAKECNHFIDLNCLQLAKFELCCIILW